MEIRCPHPQPVEVLELGTAERIDAVVEMKNPGVWILGTPMDDDRKNGMGIVIEYADKSGQPRWIKPQKKRWDYTIFGDSRPAPNPDEVIPLGVRQDQRRHRAASTVGPSTERVMTKKPSPVSSTRASDTGWSSTTKPTMRIRSICTATVSN